jgi:phosphotransferase system HPr-like phosphotransfer protein
MYMFHSLAEMPVKSEGRWYSIMIGISRPSQAEILDPVDYTNEEFNLLLFDRDPRKGVYVQQLGLDQAVAFLQLAKQSKGVVHKLFQKYNPQGKQTPIAISDLLKDDDIALKRSTADFQLVPSIEPFILPFYVDSQSAFRVRQYERRIRPFLGLREAVGLPVNESRDWANWTSRNAAFARLIYIVRGDTPLSFKPVKFCEQEDHYWDWLVGKSGSLYVRSVYVVSDDQDNPSWLKKSDHPPEFESIPGAVCPVHNPLVQVEDNVYEVPVPVSNIFGLHARPATEIALAADCYDGEISIMNQSMCADARKPVELFQLEAVQGSKVKVVFRNVTNLAEARSVYHQIYRAANNERN